MKANEKVESSKKYEPVVFVNHPISNINEDVIGFDSQIDTLLCAIDNNANMIGIIADYGTGKSSMTELLTNAVKKRKYPTPIKVNMWDCLSQTATSNNASEVSALTKSFLHQLSNGHSLKFGRFINKILSKNYGNISFSLNNTTRFVVFFLIAGLFYAIHKMLGVSGTGIMQHLPDLYLFNQSLNFWAIVLKICSPLFLIGSVAMCLLGLKDTFIAFSHWKMSHRKEPEINDVYDTYSLVADKIVPKKGKQLIFIDDLDRINKKGMIIEFLKELYRFQDSLGRNRRALVFIVSIKPESLLENETEEQNLYSKIFDLTLSLKPIHFDDYDPLLIKLLDSNPTQKSDLEQLLGHKIENSLPRSFKWIKSGSNLTLRNMKDRLNQAIAIMIALKNKDYKVKTSAEFESCAAIAYLENQYPKDYYKLIKLENDFSKFMQASRPIVDERAHIDKLSTLMSEFKTCVNQKNATAKDNFSDGFISDFCNMILSGIFNDDYRMYFYTYPKGSHIKTTDERTLCDYILLPNSHNEYDRLDDLVARVFADGDNEHISGAIKSLEKYPTILLKNDALFITAVNSDINKTFDSFSKEAIASNYAEEYKAQIWARVSLLDKKNYDAFITRANTQIISYCDTPDKLLTVRKSIARGLPHRILDFKDLYNHKIFNFVPQLTIEEIKLINNIDISLQLINTDNLTAENFEELQPIINSVPLKNDAPESFKIAHNIFKCYSDILSADQIGKALLTFLRINKHLDDEFFEIISDSAVGEKAVADYLGIFKENELSEKYLKIIDNYGFNDFVSEELITTLLTQNLFYTPLLFISKQNKYHLLDRFTAQTLGILTACNRINKAQPNKICAIRDYLYRSKDNKDYRSLYFNPYPLIADSEYLKFDNTLEAIELIDTSLIDDDNYLLICNILHNKHHTNDELLSLFGWLFDEEINEDCIRDNSHKKCILDSLDFEKLNFKDLNEEQREKMHILIGDVYDHATPQDALSLLEKYGCLVPSLEETVSKDSDLNDQYCKLIDEYDEFTQYTLKWLDGHYIRCELSEKLCKILYDRGDYQNYITATALRKNGMTIDTDIPFENYSKVYANVDEMFSIMSTHKMFLGTLQNQGDFAELNEEQLIPLFEIEQTERFFNYIFSDNTSKDIKEKYLWNFGKFKTEKDSKAFQVLICKTENMELLSDPELYRRIHERLWSTNPNHKRVFTRMWNLRWKKKLA